MGGTRGTWNTRFGFIMAAVGSAVGLGNLVRFPREMADQGGAAFLLVYLGLLILVGLPAILAEMSLGKLTDASPINAFRKLGGKHGNKWQVVGVMGVLAALFVMFFYTVIAGWALRFFFETFRDGWFDDPSGLFNIVAFGPWAIFWNGVVMAVTVFIVSRGVSAGIEKATIVMMPLLFTIVLGIVIFAGIKDAQSGFAGLKEVWQPRLYDDEGNILLGVNNISKATGQVFFSLSLGQGAMLTYASYMERKQSVTEDGTVIAFADTGVALLGAMMVFPILGFTGLLIDPAYTENTGSFGTAFVALPNAFVAMGDVVGRMVGGLFFLGLFFAALSSAISIIEVPVSVLIDNMRLPRPRAAILVGLLAYGFGVMAAINSTWLDLYDEIAVNIFIMLGAALATFFAGWYAKGVVQELNSNTRLRIGMVAVWMMRTVVPVVILGVFVYGGLFDSNNQFWGEGANWNKLATNFRIAFGIN